MQSYYGVDQNFGANRDIGIASYHFGETDMTITLPKNMDIPLFRRDVSKPENVQWLLRNLGVRNSDHPKFKISIEILKKLFKSMH